MQQKFWGMSIAALGTWEAAAFATRGRVPTISKCVWIGLDHKSKPIIRLIVIIYLLGAARHLLNGNNTPV